MFKTFNFSLLFLIGSITFWLSACTVKLSSNLKWGNFYKYRNWRYFFYRLGMGCPNRTLKKWFCAKALILSFVSISADEKINKKRTELIERLSALEKFFNIWMRILQIERACKFPKKTFKGSG
jgi:hypothetical protein